MKSDVARYCHSLGRIVRARFRRNECQRTSRIFFVRGCASLSLLARLETHTGGHARSLSHARGPLSTRARCNVDFFFFLFPSYTCGTSLRILVCRDMSANFFRCSFAWSPLFASRLFPSAKALIRRQIFSNVYTTYLEIQSVSICRTLTFTQSIARF